MELMQPSKYSLMAEHVLQNTISKDMHSHVSLRQNAYLRTRKMFQLL